MRRATGQDIPVGDDSTPLAPMPAGLSAAAVNRLLPLHVSAYNPAPTSVLPRVPRQDAADRHPLATARRPNVQRVFMTGVENMLGSNLAWALSGRCDILAGYSKSAVESSAFATTHCNPADAQLLAETLDSWQPEWIVHCPLVSHSSWDIDSAELDAPREAAIARKLATVAAARGIPLTVILSDAVFNGPRMFHDESSTPLEATPAARTLLAIERALADSPALVIRTHAYGWNGDQAASCFAERAYEALRQGRLPSFDCRRYATPILASDLADLLWHAQQTRLHGLLHLSGAERTSMQRFVQEMAACLGIPCPKAKPDPAESDWHQETSLSSRRARRVLARPTPILREGLERFLAQAQGKSRPDWCVRPCSAPLESAA